MANARRNRGMVSAGRKMMPSFVAGLLLVVWLLLLLLLLLLEKCLDALRQSRRTERGVRHDVSSIDCAVRRQV
jgi:hypothetical protein